MRATSDDASPASAPRAEARRRSRLQRAVDTLTFPVRALTLFHEDRWGLSCQATERYDYAARAVHGRCLDVGCGSNRFLRSHLAGNGVGVDVHRHEENTDGLVLETLTELPWPDGSFDSVTFLANLNHVPEPARAPELAEAHRVLRPGGTIVVTMGLPIAEVLVHHLIALYDRLLGTRLDHDGTRGMKEGECYYLTGDEIRRLLAEAGFRHVEHATFWTQWGLNGMHVGRKE